MIRINSIAKFCHFAQFIKRIVYTSYTGHETEAELIHYLREKNEL